MAGLQIGDDQADRQTQHWKKYTLTTSIKRHDTLTLLIFRGIKQRDLIVELQGHLLATLLPVLTAKNQNKIIHTDMADKIQLRNHM